jgi:hypothetical protein
MRLAHNNIPAKPRDQLFLGLLADNNDCKPFVSIVMHKGMSIQLDALAHPKAMILYSYSGLKIP